VDASNACFRVIPLKVSSGDQVRLDTDFSKEDFFASLSSKKNGKSLGLDGLPCVFYKAMWDVIEDDFCSLVVEAFSFGMLFESFKVSSNSF